MEFFCNIIFSSFVTICMKTQYAVVSALAVGIIGGWFFSYWFYNHKGEEERTVLRNGVVTYTNPYLECVGEINRDKTLVKFKNQVQEYIQLEKKKDPDLRVSVYARDLTNGPWVGINEKEPFYTASFGKVPVLVDALVRAENNPEILSQKIKVDFSTISVNNNLSDKKEFQLVDGERYSVEELLYRMIAYSDNYSLDLLLHLFPESEVDELMRIIGFYFEKENGESVTNAKSYAGLFRVLYNASVLSRGDSEYALEILAHNALTTGLKKHVSPTVPVASKFAVFVPSERSSQIIRENQFHECGIIYIPNDPHVLCVMTSSPSKGLEELENILENISLEFYRLKGVNK